jgi:flotillin
MFFYRVPRPNEAMLVSGGKHKDADGDIPFKVIVGHGQLVMPVVRKVGFISLEANEALIHETCPTNQGITLSVAGVVVFKVGDDPRQITNASRRFLDLDDTQRAMSEFVGQIMGGHLRSVVGGLTVEQLITDRASIASQVRESTAAEIGLMGLVIDSFQIKEFDDGQSGYIAAIAQKHIAQVKRDARIAQAQADQEATQAEQAANAQKAQYTRDSEVQQAEAKATIQAAQAKAAQEGPLAQAKAQQAVVEQQTTLATLAAERKAAELVGAIQKEADAQAYATKVAADAEAYAKRTVAGALEGANLQATVALAVVEKLPDIVAASGSALEGANLTIFNGAEGFTDFGLKLISQAMSVVRTATESLAVADTFRDATAHGTGGEVGTGGAA